MTDIPVSILSRAQLAYDMSKEDVSPARIIAEQVWLERQKASELLEAAEAILDGSIQVLVTMETSEKLDRLSMAIHSYRD